MINNFEQIRELLEFRSKDDFYFLQILQRKKDVKDGQKVNGTNNNSRLVKAYYVKSLDHFDFLENEVVKLCELFNARAGINLNRRSFEKMSLQHLKKVTDQIINGDYNKAHKAYSSVVGAFSNESDKKWILDIDRKMDILEIDELTAYLSTLQPIGLKQIQFIPSRSGFHLISKPFNLHDFRQSMWAEEIEVHKNNPTNLYIP